MRARLDVDLERQVMTYARAGHCPLLVVPAMRAGSAPPVKVLAPGYYASLDIRTPVRIAIVVLIATQLFNVLFVPFLQHAALTLSIGLGGLVNALWLLAGLIRRGRYQPHAGWGVFGAQVVGATLLMSGFLVWGARSFDWIGIAALPRAGLLAALVVGAVLIYFGALSASGLKLRQLLRR